MARVTKVEKARKDIIGGDGKIVVAKGESYYHWTLGFRGRKQISKTYPNKRQLTQSEHLHRIYDFEDALGNISADTPEEFQSEVESFIAEVEEYKSELEDRLSNMPDHLQDSSVLNERIDALESAISELESVDLDYEELSKDEAIESITNGDEDAEVSESDIEDAYESHWLDWLDTKREEIQGVSFD